MSELTKELEIISESWSDSINALKANLDIVGTCAPGVSVEQIDETVKTLVDWASRIRSPHGFRPIYPIIKLQLAASIKKLAATAQNLKADPATHFPTFIIQLVQCFAPITAACTFSDKAESSRIRAEISGDLQQHISLMATAQQELDKKIDILEASEETAATIATQAKTAQDNTAKIQEAINSLSGQEAKANAHLESINTAANQIKEAQTSASALEKQNQTLLEKVKQQSKTLEDLTKEALEQQKLIENLLPRATSAGLAYAFNQQRSRFGWSQAGWALTFLASVGGLITFAWHIKTGLPSVGNSDIWAYLLYRIPLASPMIWLGWFSAIQYGNVLRLKEDYAFKEATSMAFAGYREHMEHLGEISEADGTSALNKLAIVTISILGCNPLRLLQGQASDASPIEKITSILKSEQKPTDQAS